MIDRHTVNMDGSFAVLTLLDLLVTFDTVGHFYFLYVFSLPDSWVQYSFLLPANLLILESSRAQSLVLSFFAYFFLSILFPCVSVLNALNTFCMQTIPKYTSPPQACILSFRFSVQLPTQHFHLDVWWASQTHEWLTLDPWSPPTNQPHPWDSLYQLVAAPPFWWLRPGTLESFFTPSSCYTQSCSIRDICWLSVQYQSKQNHFYTATSNALLWAIISHLDDCNYFLQSSCSHICPFIIYLNCKPEGAFRNVSHIMPLLCPKFRGPQKIWPL